MNEKHISHKFDNKSKIVAMSIILAIIIGLVLIFVSQESIFAPVLNVTDSTSSQQTHESKPNEHTKTLTTQRTLNFSSLEHAITPQEHQQGLQYREGLCDTCGMLFSFESMSERVFWMPNVPFSIDIIFIDNNGKVVTVHSRAKPNQTEERYRSQPAQYVLEVPANYADNNQITEGVVLDLDHLNSQLSEFVWVT